MRRKELDMGHQPERIVLVTGAAGGVGAEAARLLTAAGTHVVTAARWDEASISAVIDSIAAEHGRLDGVIINASCGLDIDSGPADAVGLSPDAQRRLARQAVPLMPAGARIVFATTHQAHFYPAKAVPKGFAAAAASMRAGETALHALRAEFTRAGVQFTVVSGDLTDRRDMAAAVVKATDVANASGVVYVGRADYQMTA
jgi:3-oxoacyl-[acyl-carrier protein] reductase